MRDVLFLSDLDHCLFQSKRVDPNGSHPMTQKADGTAHCFSNDAQHTLMSMLAPRAVWVAVTARTVDQMQRAVGWQPEHGHQLALVNHGATLLYRETASQLWAEIEAWGDVYLAEALAKKDALLRDAELIRQQIEPLHMPAASKLIHSTNCIQESIPFYFNVQMKCENSAYAAPAMLRLRDSAELARLTNKLELEYVYHLNDNTLGFWPAYITKKIAVSRLAQALSEGLDDTRFESARAQIPKIALTLTAGDSHSDVGFMLQGDFMMTPTHSPIALSAKNCASRETNPFS